MFRDWYKKFGYCWDLPRNLQAEIYEAGFKTGMAVSKNYTANSVIQPDRVHFYNGRIVRIIRDVETQVPFLTVQLIEDDPRSHSEFYKGSAQLMEIK